MFCLPQGRSNGDFPIPGGGDPGVWRSSRRERPALFRGGGEVEKGNRRVRLRLLSLPREIRRVLQLAYLTKTGERPDQPLK